ncbi:hypothetical protein L6250_03445 [Candidatus Parcubacteria bacterium]|nr:hypothetical protein [Patescibacteria group bacterium]MBU4466567.1 hypothetical protein [Patescibacteria group bacterium]MCG2688660.1 hypothetical protein [Candidatus Parcubacteria bacterium]
MADYTKEQLRKLLLGLPEDIKEIFMANETQEVVLKVLEENDVLDERGTQISALIRNVLFGLLPPEDFKESLKKEVGLKDDIAKKIFQEINRFVFFPVKQSLASLYKIETAEETQEQIEAPTSETKETKPEKSDSYLEQIE